jgi:nitroreductase
MNTFDAIFSRRSIRHFKNEKLEWNVISDILEYANKLPMLIEGIAVEFKLVSNIEAKQGFHSPFSVKAPYYLILTSVNTENYLINAGYLMQQISLYLTAKGLGSCYMGSAKPKKSNLQALEQEYVIAMAFGEGEHEVYRSSDKARRLPVDDIAVFKTEVNKNIKTLIQAARLSPSSMNSQPWGFVVYDNRIHVFCKKNIFLSGILSDNKYIDIGICLAHLLVAAEELWIDVKPVRMDNISNITFKKNDYVLTLKMY